MGLDRTSSHPRLYFFILSSACRLTLCHHVESWLWMKRDCGLVLSAAQHHTTQHSTAPKPLKPVGFNHSKFADLKSYCAASYGLAFFASKVSVPSIMNTFCQWTVYIISIFSSRMILCLVFPRSRAKGKDGTKLCWVGGQCSSGCSVIILRKGEN